MPRVQVDFCTRHLSSPVPGKKCAGTIGRAAETRASYLRSPRSAFGATWNASVWRKFEVSERDHELV